MTPTQSIREAREANARTLMFLDRFLNDYHPADVPLELDQARDMARLTEKVLGEMVGECRECRREFLRGELFYIDAPPNGQWVCHVCDRDYDGPSDEDRIEAQEQMAHAQERERRALGEAGR